MITVKRTEDGAEVIIHGEADDLMTEWALVGARIASRKNIETPKMVYAFMTACKVEQAGSEAGNVLEGMIKDAVLGMLKEDAGVIVYIRNPIDFYDFFAEANDAGFTWCGEPPLYYADYEELEKQTHDGKKLFVLVSKKYKDFVELSPITVDCDNDMADYIINVRSFINDYCRKED